MIYPSQSLFAGRGGEGLLFISRLRIPCRMRCFYYFCMRKTNNMDIASPSSHPKAAFLIGAATSNSGKTTLTIGLLRALRERGLCVQPFKCGPDYIDPKYHAVASGRTSVNLDTWLSSPEHVGRLFARYGGTSDVSVVEGVMGLFDGYRADQGSSAEIARLLGIPVVLVVNAKSVAYSVAPLIYGFKHFDPSVRVAGVLFNQVASASHASFLQKACEDAGVPCLGYLPRMKEIELPSRHLGLTLEAAYQLDSFSQRIADALVQHVDMDRLVELCAWQPIGENALSLVGNAPSPMTCTWEGGICRIAVARDDAFNFTYHDNLERLAEAGELTYFSPMHDIALPEADFVYLPGGYPEFFLHELAANRTMLESIRSYIENGGYLLAECGGMMYLCDRICGMDAMSYPMVGVLPLEATMQGMRLHLGYRMLQHGDETFRGHEFHYSDVRPLAGAASLRSIASQRNARGEAVPTALYRYKNVLAGYTHLYWGESNLFDLFME